MSPDVGGAAGDVMRRMQAAWGMHAAENGVYAPYLQSAIAGAATPSGASKTAIGIRWDGYAYSEGCTAIAIDNNRVVPTGPANAPRRWGALACVYLGRPAS